MCVCVWLKLEHPFSTHSSPVLKGSSPAWNEFIFSAKSVRSQHKTSLSVAINMFVCSVIRIWRWVAETISSLAMNGFICSVKSYSEVSSRDYLITSNKRVHPLFGSWFSNPPKRTETRGKSLRKCFISSRDGAEKSRVSRQGEISRTLPHYRMMPAPLSGLQCNAIASLVHFVE